MWLAGEICDVFLFKSIQVTDKMRKELGFTLLELIVILVILVILASIAAPKFLDLQVDARVSRLESIQGTLTSAFQMAYSDNIINSRDSGSWGSEQQSEYDLDNDGNIEYIIWGYPLIYNSDTLRDLIYLDMCIVEGVKLCDGEAFVSEFVTDSSYALKTSYILRARVGGIVLNTCKIIINNAVQSVIFELISEPQVEVVTTGCWYKTII